MSTEATKKTTAKKSKKAPDAPRPLKAELPETVTVELKLKGTKYMALRQHIGGGEIEGHKLEISYNVASGGPIFIIGGHYYEGDLRAMTQAIFDQITSEPK